LGVILVPATATGAFSIGIVILTPIILVCGLVQAQAQMFRDLLARRPEQVVPLQTRSIDKGNLKPDFKMWEHRENLTLLEAAQLCAEIRPSATSGTRGIVKDTYAMLEGAIQKGDLAFNPEGSIHASAWDTAVKAKKSKPSPSTKLTRMGLQKFAADHGYDPEFLKDRSKLNGWS
jgi:hypothetical protein